MICSEYRASVTHTQGFEKLTAFLVVGFNFLLKMIVLVLVPKIGHKVRGQVVETIATFLFYSEFLNTGFLLLLVAADLEYSPLSFIGLRNSHPDFDQKWYLDIGPQIIKTMLIEAFTPYFMAAQALIMVKIKR